MKRIFLILSLIGCTVPLLAQNDIAALSLTHIEETYIQQNDIIQNDTVITLDYPTSITGLSVSGTATLNHTSNSLIRITLQDDYNTEWLVYELFPLLADSSYVSFNNVAFETSVLDNITAKQLNIKVINASLQLNGINTANQSVASYSLQQAQVLEAQSTYIIDKLNENLEKRNIPWRAGETPVSQMTYEEKKAMFGGEVPNLGGFEYYKGGIFIMPDYEPIDSNEGVTTLSTTEEEEDPYVKEWDWRNRHGKNWMTSVKFQAGCNSCWAFAAVGALEAYINLYYNQSLNIDLSEQELVSCATTFESDDQTVIGNGCSNRSNFFQAADYIKKYGIINEEAFPYTATNNNCDNKSLTPTERFYITDGIDKYFCYPQDMSHIKKELFISPLAMTIHDWEHAVVLVGYKNLEEDDVVSLPAYKTDTLKYGDSRIGKTALLIKNSYGDWWGEDGYGYIVLNDSAELTLYSFTGSLKSMNYDDSDITLTDNDKDGYYFAGISPVEFSLPGIDHDDSNPDYALMDDYGNLQEISIKTFYITSPVLSSETFLYREYRGTVHYNIIIKKGGKLRVDEGFRLYKNATITVESGGALEISGCTLEQADVTVNSGGTLTLTDNGSLLLRTEDSMTAELGSIVTINPGSSIEIEK